MSSIYRLRHRYEVNYHDLPSRPHLELFNRDPQKTTPASFRVFPLLPPEIRLLIWTCALRRHRMIYLSVEPREKKRRNTPKKAPSAPRYALTTDQGHPLTGNHYRIIFKARNHFLPSLLRVSRESRQAAMAFYSTKLPCNIETVTFGEREETALALNLEWDYLRIRAQRSWVHHVVDLLHDLRAHDPSGRGVRHLVLDPPFCHMDPGQYSFSKDGLDDRALAAFVATVRNLKSLWFKAVSCGRHMDKLSFNGPNVFNYGHPVFPAFTFFDPPTPDPRNVADDLKNVFCGIRDPRSDPFVWRRLLRNIGVDPDEVEASLDVRVMVGDNQEECIHSRAEAIRRLHMEDLNWLKMQCCYAGWDSVSVDGSEPVGCFSSATGISPGVPSLEGPQALANAPRPALGFWLFPVKAFGDMDEREPGMQESMDWLQVKGIFDTTEHWPELVLVRIH